MNDQAGPGVQFSPDGKWWWDGAQWQPVPAARKSPSVAFTVLLFLLGITGVLVTVLAVIAGVAGTGGIVALEVALCSGIVTFLLLYFAVSRTRAR